MKTCFGDGIRDLQPHKQNCSLGHLQKLLIDKVIMMTYLEKTELLAKNFKFTSYI